MHLGGNIRRVKAFLLMLIELSIASSSSSSSKPTVATLKAKKSLLFRMMKAQLEAEAPDREAAASGAIFGDKSKHGFSARILAACNTIAERFTLPQGGEEKVTYGRHEYDLICLILLRHLQEQPSSAEQRQVRQELWRFSHIKEARTVLAGLNPRQYKAMQDRIMPPGGLTEGVYGEILPWHAHLALAAFWFGRPVSCVSKLGARASWTYIPPYLLEKLKELGSVIGLIHDGNVRSLRTGRLPLLPLPLCSLLPDSQQRRRSSLTATPTAAPRPLALATTPATRLARRPATAPATTRPRQGHPSWLTTATALEVPQHFTRLTALVLANPPALLLAQPSALLPALLLTDPLLANWPPLLAPPPPLLASPPLTGVLFHEHESTPRARSSPSLPARGPFLKMKIMMKDLVVKQRGGEGELEEARQLCWLGGRRTLRRP